MKVLFFILSLSFMVFFTGCKNNPTGPQTPIASMVQKINNGRPYKYIYTVKGTSIATYGVNGIPFKDTYAKDGYLIIVISNTYQKYYNLSLIREVDVQKDGELIIAF